MDRESNLHSARVDEQMKSESQGLLQGQAFDEGREEWLTHEAPEDAGLARRPDVPTLAEGMPDQDEIDLRADLAAHLRPSAFPADKAALRAIAVDEGANDDLLGLLDLLPEGETFATNAEVWAATGGKVEHRDAEGYAR